MKHKQVIVLVSGSLILLALAAEHLINQKIAGSWLMTAAAILAGYDIARRAILSLRNRHISIELLVTVAAAGALVIGETWEAAAVTFLFVLGSYLEARTLSQTRQVLKGLLDLAPVTAVVLRSGHQVEVLASEVQNGEMVVIKPGMKVPVDGEVTKGFSAVDESAITGEPMPEDKEPGAKVFAGTINQNGLLEVNATGVGADTTLARIIRRVEEAQDEKAPTQRFIEKFSRWYTPAIIGLSIIVFLISRDLELSLTLLVIGCPGALVISTPISVVAGIGRAAKAGILVKGGEYLENSGKISVVALDKTGTITRGKPQVTAVWVKQAVFAGVSGEAVEGYPVHSDLDNSRRWSPEQEEVLRWALIAEANSAHPIAKAVLAEAPFLNGLQVGIPPADDFESVTGKGVQAQYQGRTILTGTPEWLESRGVSISPDIADELGVLKSEGITVVSVAVDGVLLGNLGISDPIREDAAETISKLKSSGIKKVMMLTGDDPVTARAVAKMVGIEDVRAGLLPEDKLEAVKGEMQRGEVVAMIGDGINDAPALAAADIGIAMGAGGSHIAIETADIALIADDLLKLPEAVRISRATLQNIRQNVGIAMLTVFGLLLGVLLGRVHMAGGMLVHEASVMIVILNGMRLLKLRV